MMLSGSIGALLQQRRGKKQRRWQVGKQKRKAPRASSRKRKGGTGQPYSLFGSFPARLFPAHTEHSGSGSGVPNLAVGSTWCVGACHPHERVEGWGWRGSSVSPSLHRDLYKFSPRNLFPEKLKFAPEAAMFRGVEIHDFWEPGPSSWKCNPLQWTHRQGAPRPSCIPPGLGLKSLMLALSSPVCFLPFFFNIYIYLHVGSYRTTPNASNENVNPWLRNQQLSHHKGSFA